MLVVERDDMTGKVAINIPKGIFCGGESPLSLVVTTQLNAFTIPHYAGLL